MVLEKGGAVSRRRWLSDPERDALKGRAEAIGRIRARHCVTRGPDVELARADQLLGAEAVTVDECTPPAARSPSAGRCGDGAPRPAGADRRPHRARCGRHSTRRRRFGASGGAALAGHRPLRPSWIDPPSPRCRSWSVSRVPPWGRRPVVTEPLTATFHRRPSGLGAVPHAGLDAGRRVPFGCTPTA